MITGIFSEALDWTQPGGGALEAGPQRKVSQKSGLTNWTPPEGVYPVGQGWVKSGRLLVPCFVDVEATYDGPGGTQTDHKRALKIASLPISTLANEDLEWIEASPAEATVSGKYNTARRFGGGDPYVQAASSTPWGIPGDSVGVGFREFFVEGALAVPQLPGDLQIYAINTDENEKPWQRLGWDGLAAIYAEAEELRSREPADPGDYPTVTIRNFTVLGPGRPGTILVHVVTRTLKATIAPDWLGRRLEWSVLHRVTGETIDLAFTFLGKWAYDQYDPTGVIDPSALSSATDLFRQDNGGSWGQGPGGPNKGVEIASARRPGRYEDAAAVEAAVDECLADALQLAAEIVWLGFHTPEKTAHIEIVDLATGDILATLDGETPVKTGELNINGAGTATINAYSGTDIDTDDTAFPLHPDPPPPEELDDPDRRFKHPGAEPLMADSYAGGTYEGRARGPVIMLGTDGPITLPSEDDGSIDPSTMAGWGTYYSMWSSDSMEFVSLGSPNGIAIPSNNFGDFVHGTTYPTATFHVVRCYSAWAAGDDKFSKVAPPWPFDPSTLCTDGSVAIFLPVADGHSFLEQWDSVGHQGPDSEWESRDTAAARCHKIRCYDLTEGNEWDLLWEIDTRELAGNESPTLDDSVHPCDGDAISNGVIQDGRLYVVVRGSNGQTLLQVQIRTQYVVPDDPGSGIEIAAGEVVQTVLLTEDTSLADGTSGIWVNLNELICYCPANEWYPTLQIIGSWIYGTGFDKRHWRLAVT